MARWQRKPTQARGGSRGLLERWSHVVCTPSKQALPIPQQALLILHPREDPPCLCSLRVHACSD